MNVMPGQPGGQPLIVFDGMCVMCSAWARFVMRHDTRRRFRLTTAQSATGRAVYEMNALDADAMETMIVAIDGIALTESEAIFRVLIELGWPWKMAALLHLIPPAVRDRGYRWIARNRYRWFGQRQTCWLPSSSDADRVI
jgi:salicylate hydroxylase